MRTRARAILILAGVATLFVMLRSGALVGWMWGAGGQGLTVCPLRATTGIPCGSCGMTRACTELARGDLVAASGHHLAAIPFGLFVLTLIAMLGIEAAAGKPIVKPQWNRWSGIIIWSALAIVLVGWIVNLVNHFAGAT